MWKGHRLLPALAPHTHCTTSVGSISKVGLCKEEHKLSAHCWDLLGQLGTLTSYPMTALLPSVQARRYRDPCENVMLLLKMNIVVPVLGEILPFQLQGLLSFHHVGGGGGNYFYSKPYVEHQQMHIL